MAFCELNSLGGPRAVEPAAMTSAAVVSATRSGDRGSATVIMLAAMAMVVMLTVSGLFLASAVLASQRARMAADLAALAAAGALTKSELPADACGAAARVAAANGGRVQRCVTAGGEVGLSVAVSAGMKGLGVATARSRAGTGPSGGPAVNVTGRR